jgi:hypothetical protein
MKWICTLVFLLAISVTSLCAQEMRPGYIVNVNGDSIRGFIQSAPDGELASYVPFKKNLSDKSAVNYSPSEVLRFGFDTGRTFKRITFKGDNSDSVRVFAKRTVQGKVDVYEWTRSERSHPDFFITNKAAERSAYLTEPSKEIRQKPDGTKYTYRNNRYLGLLAYVQEDSSLVVDERLSYTSKAIRDEVMSSNELFDKDFPAKRYRDEVVVNYDLTFGVPVNFTPHELHFRVALQRTNRSPEDSRYLAFFSGISYRYWVNNREEPVLKSLDYKNEFLSLLPFGLKVQGDARNFKPYCSIAVGLLLEKYTERWGKDDFVHYYMRFAIHLAAGIKIRTGSHYIIAEITPELVNGGYFANIGYSF